MHPLATPTTDRVGDTRQRRVLIVEDESIIAEELRHRMTGFGLEVVGSVASGEEAVRSAVSNGPDLVLMDIRLKGSMDGIDAAMRIRETHDPAIVFLTAHSDDSTVRRARRTLPAGYVMKPFEERDLRVAVELALYRHDADRELRLSEQRLATTLAGIADGVITTDATGHVTFVNPAAERTTGWPGADAAGQSVEAVFRLVHAESGGAAPNPVTAALREQRAVQLPAGTSLVTRLGQHVPVDDSVAPLFDKRGACVGAVLVFRDLTAHRRAESERAESDARFRQLAEAIHEVFWLTDPAKREMLYVSPAYEAIWGRPVGALYDSPGDWVGAILPEDRVRVAAAVATKQAQGTYDEEYRITRPDGSIRWIRDRAFPVRDDQGEVVRIAGVAEDVTERRQLEAQLRQTSKMDALGSLAGGIAHDFNNILTAITGHTELLLDEIDEAHPGRESLSEIARASERAASLTRQLLAFSRQQAITPRVLGLNAIVQDTESMLRRLLGEDVHLLTSLGSSLYPVRADAGLLVQVLMNLAINARDAIPRGGHVTIETSNVVLDASYSLLHPGVEPGRYVLVAVSDDGAGMPPEVRARIFEPFYTTKPPGKGTGLGLSVVHGIVKQNAGFIEVYSEVGIGTTVKIYLPASGEAHEPTVSVRTPVRGGTETILFVEDDDLVRGLVARSLGTRGYTVLAAAGGEEALRLAAQHGADLRLLVTDVVMPGMDGRQLAERIAATVPGLPVLYTSGYTNDAVLRYGILHAEVAFLQKPYSPDALARRVREMLDQRS